MKQTSFIMLALLLLAGCKNQNKFSNTGSIIAMGQMPNLSMDKADNLQLVYGSGDSVLYSFSTDGGKTFSKSSLIAVITNLAASQTRGPQIAATSNGLLVTACNNEGNIFSFIKDGSGNWLATGKVNDADTVAKENLMALSADKENAFAVWLDLRDKHNKIYGARSGDGGRTWSKNILVYASPDTTVCECCKPSVLIKGDNVFVMFRNWLSGNRDLYLIQSNDGGLNFGQAQKLGTGSWALKGCPMDGGGLALNKDGNPQTVWNRDGKLYACEPGKQEKEIGKGRSVTMASMNGKAIYAWVEKGEIVVMKPQGDKKNLGKGQLPVIQVVEENILCVWEKDKQIHSALLEL